MKAPSLHVVSIFTALLFVLNVQVVYPFIFNGNEILDLHTNGSAFAKETDAWSASSLVPGTYIYSVCDNDYIIGGYNVLQATSIGTRNQYFQRVYNSIPAHTVIRFVINIYVIDSWDSGDSFKLSFDNTVMDGLHLAWPYFPQHVCGQTGWPDIKDMKVFGNVPHNGKTLTFRALSNFDQSSYDESFGFRNVNLLFAQTPANSTYICGRSQQNLSNSTFPQKQQCNCPEGFYWNGSTCNNKCHSSCGSCFGPNATDCYACKKPQFAWNGTHCSACSQGCFSCSGIPNDGSCLPCQPGQIYYPEVQTCLDYCDYPLSLVTNSTLGQECRFPCPPYNFVFGDQHCAGSCPAPYRQISYLNTYKFCTL